MASKGGPEVGSAQWIFNELADAHRKEADHFEDFTIAFRNELEWLTEHMAEIFTQGSNIDITELYKTPGKLRGKTPRIHRKEDLDKRKVDILIVPPLITNTPSLHGNGLVTNLSPQLLERSFDNSLDSLISTPELVRDSGAWRGSPESANASLVGSFGLISSEPVERNSPAKKPAYHNAPDIVGEIAERSIFSDASHGSFASAQNARPSDQTVAANGSPLLDHKAQDPASILVPAYEAERNELLGISSDPLHSDFRRITGTDIGKGASQTEYQSTLDNTDLPATEITERGFSISPMQASSPAIHPSPISPIQQPCAIFTPNVALVEQTNGSETPSEIASPTGVARSSMNFASLPARETLTHKKSMGGVNTTGSRSSHVDDRTSLFGRLTGGKSLGASSVSGEICSLETPGNSVVSPVVPEHRNTSDEEEDEEDDDLNEQLRLAEINKTSVMQLSEKTSTQRLNEKISELGRQGASRLSKSTSNSSLSSYSQAEEYLGSVPLAALAKPQTSEFLTRPRESTQSDDGDWVPSLPQVLKTPTAPACTETMPPIPFVLNTLNQTSADSSPKKTATIIPAATKLPLPISTSKKGLDSKVLYPVLPTSLLSDGIETPSKTKPIEDLASSTVKKNQSNIFTIAKQLLWRSGRSESPKPAVVSKEPGIKQRHIPAFAEDTPAVSTASKNEQIIHQIYPELQGPEAFESLPQTSNCPFNQLDIIRTESERPIPQSEKEGLLAYGGIPKREVQLVGPSPAVIDGIDLIPEHADDILRSPVISDNEPSLPGSPFSNTATNYEEGGSDGDVTPIKTYGSGPRLVCRGKSPKPGSKAPAIHPKEPQSRISLLSKTSDVRKPNRGLLGVKDSGIVKPKALASTNTRLVAASHRELDQRKNGNTHPLSNPTTLANALAETFGKDPHARPQSAMSTSSSQGRQAPKSIAALNSAAKAQKREQEERERKAFQKQEIERKRQENLKREEARRDEERKLQLAKLSKKQTSKMPDDEEAKRKLPAGGKGIQPLFHTSKILAKTTPFSHKGPVSSKSQPELKRQPKRLFAADEDKAQKDELETKDSSHQDSKRRKTDDAGETPTTSAFAPPIRQSTTRKENLPPSKIGGIFSQEYASQPHGQNQGSTLAKSMLPPAKSNTMLPQVDAVKYSHDKLKFGTMMTPSTQKIGKKLSTVQRDSPVYPNPESIDLPDIHTDSEDDDDDRSFHVPKWADSPELRQALQDQLGIDPETIFGPIAPLSMEDIFRGKVDRAKFRARTSSANWSGADRLTAAEIEADRIERQRILENGGWTYQKP